MNIITLNTWGGRAGKERLLNFFRLYGPTTDLFCLQEIWSAPHDHFEGHLAGGWKIDSSQIMTHCLQEIADILPKHRPYFCPQLGNNFGLLTFIRKEVSVQQEVEHYVYQEKGFVSQHDIGDHARPIQCITLKTDDVPFTIINFHGLWNGRGKTDTEKRLEQSQKILDFIHTLPGEQVLCGDFNLLPDTQSIQAFERAGLKNLIKEYGITSTRTSYYTKPERYADYVFVSPTIKVTNFKVLPEEVSDHAALQVTID